MAKRNLQESEYHCVCLPEGAKTWVSNDGSLIWSPDVQDWIPYGQTAEQTGQHMIHTVVVIELAAGTPGAATGYKPERLILAPETVVARDQFTAALIVGARYPDKVFAKDVIADLLSVQVKQGL